MCIRGRRLAVESVYRPGGVVKTILPDQLVGETESVPLKFKRLVSVGSHALNLIQIIIAPQARGRLRITMLYDRWQRTACERRREIALQDPHRGQAWTFEALAHAVEAELQVTAPIVYPQGHSAEFIIEVLRGWRANRVVCPLEASQPRPFLTNAPPGCAHLKITSATAGTQRCVAFTGDQLAADADNLIATMGLKPDWPNVGAISLAHSYGFSNLVLPLLLHGIPLILCSAPLPEMVRRAASIASDITLPGVPALWRAWHEAGAIPQHVRLAISAGAPLPQVLEQAVFNDTGLKIHNFYGSSECGGIAFDATAKPRTDESCVGTPVQNVELQVNEAGCLQVRGRAVGETYWPEPEDALSAGCFQTSDVAELREGQVFLLGRAGDVINVAGRKVSPEAIEKVLRQHHAVSECLVFGVPSNNVDRSEKIVAVVAVCQPVESDILKQFLLEHLSAWQVPRAWWFVKILPANQRGKISRTEWRERFLKNPNMFPGEAISG
jgi:long-chain acyl-CoA synthetase